MGAIDEAIAGVQLAAELALIEEGLSSPYGQGKADAFAECLELLEAAREKPAREEGKF